MKGFATGFRSVAFGAVLAAGALSAGAAQASGTVLGAVVGGGVGAVIGQSIGGRDGAVIGGALGAAAGAAAGSNHDDYGGRGYGAAAWPAPVYGPAPVYYRVPPRVVYARPPRVVYRPVYVAPPPPYHARSWRPRHERRHPDRGYGPVYYGGY